MKTIKSVDQNFVEIEGTIKVDRPQAILFSDGTVEVWLPKSQIEEIEWGENKILIPEWLAKDKGLI